MDPHARIRPLGSRNVRAGSAAVKRAQASFEAARQEA